MRILLIEDDPLNIDLFESALETEGHVLTIERDGVAGQARALGDAFDLILLDVQLPYRSGLDVCRQLRAAGVRTPIVALSASVLRDEIARASDAGFTEFLAKPIKAPALRAAVRAYAAPNRPPRST